MHRVLYIILSLIHIFSENEKAVAGWVLKNNKRAGATTGTLSNAKCLYLAVRSSSMVYGVIGIVMGEIPLDPFENSILLSLSLIHIWISVLTSVSGSICWKKASRQSSASSTVS